MNDLISFDYAEAEARTVGMFAGLRMSSREIAKLTGKRHADVMRDIRVLVNQGAILESNFAFQPYEFVGPGGGVRQSMEYILDFKATMVLTTGYDAKRRAAVVERWMELEEEKANPVPAPQFYIPKTHAEALRLYADTLEAKEKLEHKVAEDAPKVAFADAVANSDGCLNLTETGKLYGIGNQHFCEFLRLTGRLFKRGKVNLPIQKYVDKGIFKVVLVPYGDKDEGKTNPQTMVTDKGQKHIANLVLKYRQMRLHRWLIGTI